MLKISIALLLVFQITLIAYGIWMVQQPTPLIAGSGWFVIIANIVFGGLNVKNLLDA